MSAEIVSNLCPVCGYGMSDPPDDYNICPSCGTEFGVNDRNCGKEQLRKVWIAKGPQWWSKSDPRPEGWNPWIQLARVDHSVASGQ